MASEMTFCSSFESIGLQEGVPRVGANGTEQEKEGAAGRLVDLDLDAEREAEAAGRLAGAGRLGLCDVAGEDAGNAAPSR